VSYQAVEAWIDGTSLSLLIKSVAWIIPAVQSVHILAIAVVMSSTLLMNLGLAGVLQNPGAEISTSGHYLWRVWVSLVILAVSGLLLIIGEPERTLPNPVFWTKMSLLTIVIVITLATNRPAVPGRTASVSLPPLLLKGFAWTSIILWVAIIFCGRWIAYSSAA
jgi:hypothetical protein